MQLYYYLNFVIFHCISEHIYLTSYMIFGEINLSSSVQVNHNRVTFVYLIWPIFPEIICDLICNDSDIPDLGSKEVKSLRGGNYNCSMLLMRVSVIELASSCGQSPGSYFSGLWDTFLKKGKAKKQSLCQYSKGKQQKGC